MRKGPRPPRWWQRTLLGFPIWMVLGFVAVVAVVFAVIALSGDPGSDGADRLQTADSAVTTRPQPAATVTTFAPPTTVAPTTTTIVAATTTVVFTIPSEAPTIVVPTTGASPIPASTSAPSAAPTTVRATPTLPPDGPVVTIIGSVGPCRFGSECLLAGFALHNFDSQPTEFVCEFADGSRFTFRFTRQEVERACATGDPTDSITIEVDGVRSATYQRP